MKPVFSLIRHEVYVKRLVLFFLIYFSLNYFYPLYTKTFFHFHFLLKDPFFLFLFPGLLLLLFIFKWDEIQKIHTQSQKYRWKKPSFLFLFLATVLFLLPILTIYGKHPDDISRTINSHFLITYYGQLILANYFLFLGIFGKYFSFTFKKEIACFLGTIGLYLGASFFVEYHWRFFSEIILNSLNAFFHLLRIPTKINPETFAIKIQNFEVYIGATCAGIYSMATFIFLFFSSIVMLKKERRVDITKAGVLLLLGLCLVFVFNILRIALILLFGAYVSAELAIDLFHEYLSAVFLIAIFLVFLYKFFPKILK